MWKKQNLSAYKIAKKLKISHNSAKEIIQKYQETKTVHDRPHPGRKRKLSPAETKKVVRMAKKRKFAPEIARSCKKPVCARRWQFLQDNSRVHTAKKSMAVLKELVGDRLLSHPAKSPDLNPIENMWSYLDRRVKESSVTSISG